ncbi:hypothetical protein SASPL_117055 [Salvia splendens]|uniref:Zinc finger LSD1-type domain-containing protein n=1 Tax=Salvia splendens TaxID=180675 RepID=A0A8X8ZYJ1_SALSN|nr:hypothetical protein SASPL_117055 [Salvia splendens]
MSLTRSYKFGEILYLPFQELQSFSHCNPSVLQICRAKLFAVGVEPSYFTQAELQMFAVQFAIWSLRCHHRVESSWLLCMTWHASSDDMLDLLDQLLWMEMAQLICGGCRTLLMHARGATSVRCSCCHTVNLVPAAVPPNNVAHVNCGNCHTMLMYPAGAPSVKCAICHFITNVNMGDTRVPIPVNRPAGNSNSAPTQSTSTVTTAHSHNQTVVVQNPMTVDESGKLVSNVVVGVTT